MKEIKCFTSTNNFFPSNYLTDSLSSDAKDLGVDGQKLKSLKKDIEPKLLSLSDGQSNTDIRSSQRKDLIEQIYKTLGYYDVDNTAEYQKFQPLKIRNRELHVPVEGRFRFKGDGELWILSHYPETANGLIESFQESEKNSEFFFDSATCVQIKDKPASETFKHVIDAIFDGDQTKAEYIIVNQGNKLFLLERGKWQEGPQSYLELNLTELFSEINANEYYVMAESLFSPKAFPITSAENFHEILERNAYKKASEVTKALRDSVRISIETIADEVLRQHGDSPLKAWKGKDFTQTKDRAEAATELFDQTIKFIYRMLFMLFTESQERSKGALPVYAKIYQLGYSIEKLRDLEGVPYIASQKEQSQSYFINETLNKAFQIYYSGYNNHKQRIKDQHSGEEAYKTDALGFSFPSIGTQLFNIEATPIFKEIKLPDAVLQIVLRNISLAKTGKGRGARTHRVHYAALGLNQLGAVYEGLLTLKPEILSEKVILLQKKEKDIAHCFVPYKHKDDFDSTLFESGEDKKLVTKEKGEFLLTPVGLERKFSASFYTPEVLTRFLAKESVDTLLGVNPTLEQMENLKILEPAMGSGAFLNAVVDEIAPKMAKLHEKPDRDLYEKKLAQLVKDGTDKNPQALSELKKIAPRPINHYVSKAKNHLMRNCVYGVDLNATAVELAKISLWLNCLHEDGNLPFLDMKLRHGNSLVGAWIKRHEEPTTSLPHFFFPMGQSLAPHLDGRILGDKKRPVITDEKILQLVKSRAQEFDNVKKDKALVEKLKSVHKKTMALFEEHLKLKLDYQKTIQATENPNDKEKLFKDYVSKNTAYNRLRTMMDLWCALWYWPHNELKSLPTAKDFVAALSWIAEEDLSYGPDQIKQLEKSGYKFLAVAKQVALEIKFFHYDLEYAEVFEQGGFDLVLGNPPWAPVRWEEADFFEMVSPGIHAVKGDSKQLSDRYSKFLQSHPDLLSQYIDSMTKSDGFANFLKHSVTYSFEDSSKTNTYKYFYQRFYEAARPGGIHAMIAQDGILTDDGCIAMRSLFYNELKFLFSFINHLMLFEDIDSHVKYSIWINEKGKKEIAFKQIANLYHPETIQKCKAENINSSYPGMKNDEGGSELRGHPKRIVQITADSLKILGNFDPEAKVPSLPAIHGEVELNVLETLAMHPKKLGIGISIDTSTQFNESNSPRNGFIKRAPGQPKSIEFGVMTGPNIFVATPANKSPNPECKSNGDFFVIDLEDRKQCPDSFFPDTVYQMTEKGLNSGEYNSQTPWGTKFTDQYRILARQMVSTTGARTLSTCIIPPGPSHIHGMLSLVSKDQAELVYTSGLFHSLIYDFFARTTCGGNLVKGTYKMMPTLTEDQLRSPQFSILISHLSVRTLRLNSISTHYKDLWKDQYTAEFSKCDTESDFKPKKSYSDLTAKWDRDTCIRNTKEREQALCEIDAIVAILFGFSKETLINLYRSQFGVLQKQSQDLPNQKPDSEGFHFPRAKAMAAAYDQFAKLIDLKVADEVVTKGAAA